MRNIDVPIKLKAVIEVSRGAVLGKHLLKFYYESKNGNKAERIIRPYMIIPRGKILELVGTPIAELVKEKKDPQPGHYVISQLESRLQLRQLEVLPEAFDDPGVLREIVVMTKTPPVCRFMYDDEDLAKVAAEWLDITYV